jgi:hypothetical protein
MMRLVYILAGWGLLIIYPFKVYFFLTSGRTSTRWGMHSKESSLGVLIAIGLTTLLFGRYSIIETWKIIKNKYFKKK